MSYFKKRNQKNNENKNMNDGDQNSPNKDSNQKQKKTNNSIKYKKNNYGNNKQENNSYDKSKKNQGNIKNRYNQDSKQESSQEKNPSRNQKPYDKKGYRNKDNFKKRNSGYRYKKQEKFKREPIVLEPCSICNELIKEPLNAILHKETFKNAHFECIVKEIKKEKGLDDSTILYYLGSGNFGIVEEKKHRHKLISYTIIEKFNYINKAMIKKGLEEQAELKAANE